MQSAADQERQSPWPHRFAVATLVAAIPLLAFGGQVTTLGAGLAIDGWWVLEPGRGDHVLWFYPVEKWFRDPGTFTEHTHRLFGTLVGLLSIATVIAAFVADPRRAARVLATAGLVTVCVQGTIGGFRVLERSDGLAFLHGVLGQGVFAVLAAVAVFLSPRWRRQTPAACKCAPGLRRAAQIALVLVYLTIGLGAWLRHQAGFLPLVLHLVGVFASSVALLVLARRLMAAAEAAGAGQDRSVLRSNGVRILVLLGVQVLLGLAAFAVVFLVQGDGSVNLHQSLFPTLHVLFGALLLAQTVAATLWSRRVLAAGNNERYAASSAVGVTA